MPDKAIDVRKGMPDTTLERAEFERRFKSRFADPAFEPLQQEISAIAAVAWDGYTNGRKSPVTRKAGPGFADPDYELSVDWLKARDAIIAAQARHDDARQLRRVLLINGSSRSEHTCPGEESKTWRLVKIAEPILAGFGLAVDILDLSRLTSEMGRQIHPCKSCVSTAMPLCHWPCSCYPNYSLEQTDDWMNEIYPLWVAAHGIMIITPVNWYQAPTGLKAMIDRLVCADGGNADPTSTHGKKPAEAKALELKGWDFPKHLAGRLFSVIVHGDSTGRGLDWGLLLSHATILALTLAFIAQSAVYIAETSRLPMVAAWDHLLPAWFTRLHPRYGTPTRSLAVIVAIAVAFSLLASSGTGANEAFQLLATSSFVCYGINYLLMFAVPLLVGTRLSLRPELRPPVLVRAACVCGASVTVLSIIFNLVPIVDVARPWVFALKVGSTAVGINLIGAAIYWRGSRPKVRSEQNAA